MTLDPNRFSLSTLLRGECSEAEIETLDELRLDYAVAKVLGQQIDGLWRERDLGAKPFIAVAGQLFAPSRRWEHCGPLMTRHKIGVVPYPDGTWQSMPMGGTPVNHPWISQWPQVAAMRCLLLQQIGGMTVAIPDELNPWR